MSVITFDVAAFRAAFPAFASEAVYSDESLQIQFDAACSFISPETSTNWYIGLKDAVKTRALYLMTAHLVQLSTGMVAGQTPGQVQSSGIDKISVSMTPPPQRNQWQWWLGLTGYGQQLFALLQLKASGGFYVGGLPELRAFRKVGGVF